MSRYAVVVVDRSNGWAYRWPDQFVGEDAAEQAQNVADAYQQSQSHAAFVVDLLPLSSVAS